MSCLAGIGGQLSGFVQSAKDVPVMVAIDGCQVGCARAILKNAQVPLKNYLVVTEEGVEKSKYVKLERADVDRVKAAGRRVVNQSIPADANPSAGGCGCHPLPHGVRLFKSRRRSGESDSRQIRAGKGLKSHLGGS